MYLLTRDVGLFQLFLFLIYVHSLHLILYIDVQNLDQIEFNGFNETEYFKNHKYDYDSHNMNPS